VCYDVGRVMKGGNWRPKFDPKIIHRELEIIKRDLHCNAVRICGLDIDRLLAASKDASNKDSKSGSPPKCGTELKMRHFNT
jgi:hypothetical protein